MMDLRPSYLKMEHVATQQKLKTTTTKKKKGNHSMTSAVAVMFSSEALKSECDAIRCFSNCLAPQCWTSSTGLLEVK